MQKYIVTVEYIDHKQVSYTVNADTAQDAANTIRTRIETADLTGQIIEITHPCDDWIPPQKPAKRYKITTQHSKYKQVETIINAITAQDAANTMHAWIAGLSVDIIEVAQICNDWT